ncbi:MAG: DUF2911 domain-containing protein [Bacteroidota bacterium]
MKTIACYVCLICSCVSSPVLSQTQYLVTLLGNDTLAVESFEKTDDGIRANVILRSPRTRFLSYNLDMDENGNLTSYTAEAYEDARFETGASNLMSVRLKGGAYEVGMNRRGEWTTLQLDYEPGILPFIDMVHWPFELAFNRAMKSGQDSVSQPLLTGSRTRPFIIAKIEADSLTIRHPSRGVMGVKLNEQGDILRLDASQTTRKLTVKRVAELDMASIGSRFAALDAGGKSFGGLSGAVEERFAFNGGEYTVSYGSPSKRGRTIFGGIVPWGQRWRTGANRATHFSTSKDLMIGSLEVPAGEYTLFTIPESSGGTLIINTQTGQNGRTYDKARDLGRVTMMLSEQDEVVEAFTITVEETESGGVINLKWDQAIFSIPFRFKE